MKKNVFKILGIVAVMGLMGYNLYISQPETKLFSNLTLDEMVSSAEAFEIEAGAGSDEPCANTWYGFPVVVERGYGRCLGKQVKVKYYYSFSDCGNNSAAGSCKQGIEIKNYTYSAYPECKQSTTVLTEKTGLDGGGWLEYNCSGL